MRTRFILADRIGRGLRRSTRPLRSLSAGHWFALVGLAGSFTLAFGIAPDTTLDIGPNPVITRALPLPPLNDVALDAPLWREERVQRGDTIGSLLARAGVSDAEAIAWMRSDAGARPLYQLRPGRPVRVAIDGEGHLAALRFLTAGGDMFAVSRGASGFDAQLGPARAEVQQALRAGVIESSLFGAADDAGLPDAITMALAEIFAGDIDFLKDLRRGDRFSVIYETRRVEGEPAGVGRILAAEFVNRGTVLRAFLWHDEQGEEGYYTEDGLPNRKAFLRSPLEFSRITSGFSLARFHPILQKWRAHRGIDYAAPVGTPVRATGDGVVRFAGAQNGYGNVILLQHGSEYSSVYAHLSRFAGGLRSGAHVRQGETIGYVGATGWATGPHLHYEFRIAGEARNPLTVALPHASPIAPERQSAFRASAALLSQQLGLARALPAAALAATD